LYQKYQDCIGIYRKFGCPNLFVTFTCNAAWVEIQVALPPSLTPSDRLEIFDHVFKMKLNILMDDIKKRNFLDLQCCCIHSRISKTWPSTCSYHYLVKKDRPWDAAMVDTFILAQLPNRTGDLIGYEVVSSFMVYGPYSPHVTYSPYITDGECFKLYTKTIL
jgi:hypothetical protein